MKVKQIINRWTSGEDDKENVLILSCYGKISQPRTSHSEKVRTLEKDKESRRVYIMEPVTIIFTVQHHTDSKVI